MTENHAKNIKRLPVPPRSKAFANHLFGNHYSRHKNHLVFLAFTFMSFSILGYLVYLSLSPQYSYRQIVETFPRLHEAFRMGGSQLFLENKASLRKMIARALEQEHSSDKQRATTNIAVYLFPDLLSDDNLEKEVAEELWVPQQKAIENAPGTAQSQALFEEMRANITNYENPKRENPEVSEEAKQVIRIYETLAVP